MLLEEALAGKGGQLSPQDTALALLSFLRDELPAGGIGAERRFVNMLLPILDRVFGEWNTKDVDFVDARSSPSSSPSNISSSPTSKTGVINKVVNDYRHAEGGWLGQHASPAVARSSRVVGTTSPSSSLTSSTIMIENDPIVRLLRAPALSVQDDGHGNNDGGSCYMPPTLIDAMTAICVRFGLPLGAMTNVAPSLIDNWRVCFDEMDEKMGGGGAASISIASGTVRGTIGKENATRILTLILAPNYSGSKGQISNDQLGLKRHFQLLRMEEHIKRGGQQRHGGGSGFGASPPSKPSPSSSSTQMNSRVALTQGTPEKIPPSPSVDLTMLEYYLTIFIRFPLCNPTWSERSSQTLAYGQRIYRHLLAGYFDYYLSHGQIYNRQSSLLGIGIECFDRRDTSTFVDPEVASHNRMSELFLRLIIELWMEGRNVAPTTSESVSRYRQIRTGTIGDGPTLRDSLELARPVRSDFVQPPVEIMKGIITLIRHLISDVSMWERVHETSSALHRRQREEREGKNTFGEVGEIGSSLTPECNEVSWPLPPALTAIQPSHFNYIRMGLSCGAIHDRGSIFYGALETWLAYLEPWNYVLKQQVGPGGNIGVGTGGTAGDFLRSAAASVSTRRRVKFVPFLRTPKPTSPSAYNSKWESFIVCNAHYYTVPLAIFLKRARELDFSNAKEYSRSLVLVQRVLRIYSPSVVTILNSVLNTRRADALTAKLFEDHEHNLGAFSPPPNGKLIDCQLDMTNLLEEMYAQNLKRRTGLDILERMEAKLNALFEGKIGGEEVALENVLLQARYLVSLPQDYQVLPEEPHVSSGLWSMFGLGSTGTHDKDYNSFSLPARGPDGKLTDEGRQQLSVGLCKCDPVLTYIGDPLLSAIRSYEIPVLVELFVWISSYLNEKFLLTAPPPSSEMDNDDVLSKRFREMKQYNEVKFRFNLRFLADKRNLMTILIIYFCFSYGRGISFPSISMSNGIGEGNPPARQKRPLHETSRRTKQRQTVSRRGSSRNSQF
jgi:hypothetical protein